MEGETSKNQYKLIEYNDTLYEIPIRNIEQEQVLLLSDVQSLLPKATAFLSHSKLVPFQLDSKHMELIPKRIIVSNSNNDNNVLKVYIPTEEQDLTNSLIQSNIELQIKMEQLSNKLDHILTMQRQSEQESEQEEERGGEGEQAVVEDNNNTGCSNSPNNSNGDNEDIIESNSLNINHQGPPAFSLNNNNNNNNNNASSSSSNSNNRQQHEAPPSYETSVLSTVKSINDRLRLYESHIYNRHKSPKWLAKRQDWLSREPNSIEEVAYQLVQLEMALLWTAVSESWIQERETWLSLVASARSERHLAGAIINLERHTLVMDEDWNNIRERWINELLEMLVLPISH
jgi:hypothetical protein